MGDTEENIFVIPCYVSLFTLSQIRKSMTTEGADVFVCCMLDEVSSAFSL